MEKFIFFFILILSSISGQTQEVQKVLTDNQLISKMDFIIQDAVFPFMNDSRKMGLSVGIFNNGEKLTYNYGITKPGNEGLPTKMTVYEIGSISKTFTGTLLAQAVIDKNVRIDDDVRLYLDECYPNLEYDEKPIKLFHLLNHTSGLPNFLPDRPELFENPNLLPYLLSDIQNNYSKQDFLGDLHDIKLNKVPGFKYKYSNSAAQLLKFILERVYQMPYDNLLEKYINQPLKMTNTTTIFSNNNPELLVKGYNGEGKIMPYIPQTLDAAGGIYSNVDDMLSYLKFHLDETNEVVVLSHKVTTGNINHYAVGLNWQEQLTSDNVKKIWQSGGTFGFSSYCVVYPKQNFAIVLLSNEAGQNSQSELAEIAKKIFENNRK